MGLLQGSDSDLWPLRLDPTLGPLRRALYMLLPVSCTQSCGDLKLRSANSPPLGVSVTWPYGALGIVVLTSPPWFSYRVAMPTFESTLREHRIRAGLSQERLSRLLGVSRQTVVNIERGESEPRVFLALAMAAIFGVAVGELFRRKTAP